MGLDSVELVMDVEDHFGISLSDRDAERVRTVRDLVALVTSRLPRFTGACSTAKAFYIARAAMVEAGGVSRRAIRPATDLESLFAARRGRRWFRIRHADHLFPPLGFTTEGVIALWALGIAATLMCVAVGALAGWVTGEAAAAGVAVLLALCGAMMGMAWAGVAWRTSFPAGMRTVGDLAKYIAPKLRMENAPAEELDRRVLVDIQKIVSEQLGIPIEQVRLESHLIRDLGMG